MEIVGRNSRSVVRCVAVGSSVVFGIADTGSYRHLGLCARVDEPDRCVEVETLPFARLERICRNWRVVDGVWFPDGDR